MVSLHEIERRNPERLVIATFLWAPAILIPTLALTDNWEATAIALVVAGLPYVGVLLWPFYVALRDGSMVRRAAILLGLLMFAVFAVAVNWRPLVEY